MNNKTSSNQSTNSNIDKIDELQKNDNDKNIVLPLIISPNRNQGLLNDSENIPQNQTKTSSHLKFKNKFMSPKRSIPENLNNNKK